MLARLLEQWRGRHVARRVLAGGFWLGVEQVFRLALGLWVGVWVARYLGPGDFGLLNAALAVVAVLGGVASLGLDAILARKLALAPRDEDVLLGTAFFLKLGASSLLWLGCVVLATSDVVCVGGEHRWLLPFAATSLIFQSLNVVERKLETQGGAKRMALIRCLGAIASCAIRLVLILNEAPLTVFALAGAAEFLVAAVGWIWLVRRGRFGIRQWSFSPPGAEMQLREGWPLMCAGLATLLQGYGDQILLGYFGKNDELGNYAAALRVVMIFSFLPMVLQAVAGPEIARARQDDEELYRRRLGRLYRLALAAGLATSLPLAFAGPRFVDWLYGEAYAEVGALLPLLALRLILTNLGVARGIFLTTEGMVRFVFITASLGALINLGLNLFLIPRWGAEGAILASLISFSVTTFGFEWASRRARWNLRVMTAVLLRPWRVFD